MRSSRIPQKTTELTRFDALDGILQGHDRRLFVRHRIRRLVRVRVVRMLRGCGQPTASGTAGGALQGAATGTQHIREWTAGGVGMTNGMDWSTMRNARQTELIGTEDDGSEQTIESQQRNGTFDDNNNDDDDDKQAAVFGERTCTHTHTQTLHVRVRTRRLLKKGV